MGDADELDGKPVLLKLVDFEAWRVFLAKGAFYGLILLDFFEASLTKGVATTQVQGDMSSTFSVLFIVDRAFEDSAKVFFHE